ncbi:diguanylate cyclase domain-containing protein [Azohydromonas caseinilytica]|uniref:Diguanylate cyclase n=1 Tax=Azohydromonas caseinilytica TaxID=2728836 RepID=A0A848F8C5_9BURK|nr:diguanylate cyclase [Azohydromonas caseinilytica]NML16387.1 diguanylate cyclase [Azohydromonas caseinilytica]
MLHRITRLLRLTQFLALLLVIGLGTAGYAALSDFERDSREVERTHAVLEQIGQIRHEALRSAVWLRNFMVVPDKDLLQRVRSRANEARQAADRLLALADHDPAQSRRLQPLRAKLLEVLDQYRGAANIGERQGAAALQSYLAARMEHGPVAELRELLDQAQQAERELLQSHTRHKDERFGLIRRLLAGGGVALAACLLGALALSGRLRHTGPDAVAQPGADALHDPLTGLLNRRGLEQQLAGLAREPRGHGHSIAVLAFDLDDFKAINERFSRTAGDQVLQEVACRLQQRCRGGDVIARVDGDGFVVVLRSIASRLDAETVAKRIRAQLMAPIPLGTAVLRIGASIGIALLHEDGTDMDALLRAADGRMCEVKKAGKQQVRSSTQILEPVGF